MLELLSELEAIDGLVRIRLNSIEPGYLTDGLIERVAGSARVCRHFHVPLQSGDDRVLRRMGRGYTRAAYAERIERIARSVPEVAIGADVMVGFPGEDEAGFAATCDLVRALPLTYLHVFSYSDRASTPATRLPDQVPPPTKADRARRLIRLGQEKRLAFHRRFLGRELEVLVEDRRDPATGLPAGLSDNYVKVVCEGAAGLANRFARVRVARAREDLVFGEVSGA
jgi:threonylcarbamoyladenosine tRNA methylthiotransferase MtaB